MIFSWVIWFQILIIIFIDIFRRHDLPGWAKAPWFIVILVFPPIGVVVYLIARGGKMHEHARDAQLQEQQFRSYVREAAGSQSPADQLAKLADLRDRGVITAGESDREKAKILARHEPERIGQPGAPAPRRRRLCRRPGRRCSLRARGCWFSGDVGSIQERAQPRGRPR